MKPHDCNSYRDRVLEQLLPKHVTSSSFEECAECAEWLRRARQHAGVLGSLDFLLAPQELEESLTAEIQDFPRRLELACKELTTMKAPSALDALVAARIEEVSADTRPNAGPNAGPNAEPNAGPNAGTDDSEDDATEVAESTDQELEADELSRSVQALSELQPLRAPDVLDRLVAEELAQGPEAGMIRSVRELERKSAPEELNASPIGSADEVVAGDSYAGDADFGTPALELVEDSPRDESSSVVAPWLARAARPLGLVAAAALFLMTGLSSSWFGLAKTDKVTAPSFWAAGEQTGFEGRLAASTQPYKSRSFEAIRVDGRADLGLMEEQMVLGLGGAFATPIRPALPLNSGPLNSSPLNSKSDLKGGKQG